MYSLPQFTAQDKRHMRRALCLAKKAQGMTSPNPMVGAVIVKDGRVIAEDYHKRAGEPHAEALVLSAAGQEARGADLYVTLEPCCHLNKRTPPCTRAIISAGIRRVFVAAIDPNPAVSGCGIKELQTAGVEVYKGLLTDKAKELNEAYEHFIVTGRPFVILKTAMTLDGKIADPLGNSKWITGASARQEVHRIRHSVDAVITAKGTVLADNPQLTVRLKTAHSAVNPLRVVIDPALEVPLDFNVFNKDADTAVAYSTALTQHKADKIASLRKRGCSLFAFDSDRIALSGLINRLKDIGVSSVLIEGGSSLNARAFIEEIVDKVVFFIAPKIISGSSALPVTGGEQSFTLDKSVILRDMKIKRFGSDIMITGYTEYSKYSNKCVRR